MVKIKDKIEYGNYKLIRIDDIKENPVWFIVEEKKDITDRSYYHLLESNELEYIDNYLPETIVENILNKMRIEDYETKYYVYKNVKYNIVNYLPDDWATETTNRLEIHRAQETEDIFGTKFIHWVNSSYLQNNIIAEWLVHMIDNNKLKLMS